MARKILSAHYTVSNVPALGLSPTTTIWELNALTPLVNTLVVSNGNTVEIGGGWYRYDFLTYDPTKSYVFTFDGGATLDSGERYKYGGNESYEEDVSFGVWEEPAIDHTGSGTTGLMLNQIKADTATILVNEASISAILNIVLQYERGRTKIDIPSATLTVYDTDGTTPLQVFDLLDHLGNPSVQEVCERVPTL